MYIEKFVIVSLFFLYYIASSNFLISLGKDDKLKANEIVGLSSLNAFFFCWAFISFIKIVNGE